ncbi:hypothetical protein H257_04048 [Aphanomyces astaci]|uniref:RWP-RK domain-containing protein n=1 Tax=Aphanomyces astaci TaxID=112090 RepID=W4GVF2_APHAT|nr:hypothetical protein H257_04048 [Aphanomyces astaci]ETV83291.1 hypothetical protein H257_04048 [Aphanomyces astaci]KAF0749532.1 hypothetical protein AaE_007013 [Aphanomyces astaci]|eukprot:XP_009826721.1 hypothetical protein H257_04048 [Aphanomyces astaci]
MTTPRQFTAQELGEYYHMPLKKAAKELQTYEAALIRACRRHDIPKWPYRQLAKIDRQMRFMDVVLTKLGATDDAGASDKTTACRQKLERSYASVKANTRQRKDTIEHKLRLSYILNP